MGKVVRKKICDSVIDEIRRMILNGELKEGDKLPNQNDFAQSLNVSRLSLREALQTLDWMGAVQQRPGLGTFLISRAPIFLVSGLELPLMSDAEATFELLEARRLFESRMVDLVVTRASDEEIADIGLIMSKMEAALARNNVNEYQEQDLIFHSLVARASHNRFIVQVFEAIHRSLKQFLKEAFTVRPDMIDRSMTDHKQIYKALLNRDHKQAVDAMNSHLTHVRRVIEEYYENQEKQK